MKANPGGQLSPENVIGRDELIEDLWDTLEQQSIHITAERRIGKTSIMRKMCDSPREGWKPIYQDLEKVHTAMDFSQSVYNAVLHFLTKKKKVIRLSKEVVKALGGTEIAGVVKIPATGAGDWKILLQSSIQDLMDSFSDGEEKLVFFWDEVPYMLDGIRKKEGAEVALEVLDVLRSLRQEHHAFRMVITGSIGIHHVLSALRGNSKTALNDVYKIEVPPLSREAAITLSKALIKGEELRVENEQAVAEVLAEEVDCFAYYIHHIVKAIRMGDEPISEELIKSVVLDFLSKEDDPWELYHYRDRIEEYYGKNEFAVLCILDELTLSYPLDKEGILKILKIGGCEIEKEDLLNLLRLMVQDHYLSKSSSGMYMFKFNLIKRWWGTHRGL